MEAEHRLVTIDRYEWVLKSPAHHTEVEKTVAVAKTERAQRASRGGRAGDIHIMASDDEVVVSFEIERPKNPKRGTTFRDPETTHA
ncbi:hypothetical protein ACIQPQ_34585 [Streptomyces sp. NPDC091281]|uniref:hypothetical protein n=1 Tax=Streptomyces sp. NPDC091281 TaxID=3365985 RepID=UPI0037FB9229